MNVDCKNDKQFLWSQNIIFIRNLPSSSLPTKAFVQFINFFSPRQSKEKSPKTIEINSSILKKQFKYGQMRQMFSKIKLSSFMTELSH